MTAGERRIVAEYIRAVADRMGLRDWSIRLLEAPADDGLDGQCFTTHGRRCARIYLAAAFRDDDPSEQRETIVHELLHCHFAVTQDMTGGRLLRETMGERAWSHYHADWNTAHELAVDAIARAWAPAFPLISWPKKGARVGKA